MRTPTAQRRPGFYRLYARVHSAIQRCTNPQHPQYHNYGGRGIRVHPGWVEDPTSFVEYLFTLPGHDNRYLYMDRDDNNGHYEPGNIRFVTASESARNRRNCRSGRDSDPSTAEFRREEDLRLRRGAEAIDFRALRGKRAQITIALAANVSVTVVCLLERHGPHAVSARALRKIVDFYKGELCSPTA